MLIGSVMKVPSYQMVLYKKIDSYKNFLLGIILPFLSDVEPEVRGTAACNLGEIKDNRAINYLINTATQDKDEDVRADALSALAEYRSPEILSCLISEVHREKLSRHPRQEVARQLKYYNTEETVDALIIITSRRRCLCKNSRS